MIKNGVFKTNQGFPMVTRDFFTTLSTEKVNKMVPGRSYLFITLMIAVSYSIVIRCYRRKRVVYRFQRV